MSKIYTLNHPKLSHNPFCQISVIIRLKEELITRLFLPLAEAVSIIKEGLRIKKDYVFCLLSISEAEKHVGTKIAIK